MAAPMPCNSRVEEVLERASLSIPQQALALAKLVITRSHSIPAKGGPRRGRGSSIPTTAGDDDLCKMTAALSKQYRYTAI